MQYEQVAPGERVPLPRPSIDTGMGLERIAALLQGVASNYETDLFRALTGAVADLTNVTRERPAGGQPPRHRRSSARLLLPDRRRRDALQRGARLRAAPNHAPRDAPRAIAGRRRSLDVASRSDIGRRKWAPPIRNCSAPRRLIGDTLLTEETRFRVTLARGLAILDEETAGLSAGARLSGETAFKLYDTFGFPLDLTEDALRPRGIGVDKEAFESAMERQRAEARKAWAGSGETATEAVWYALKERVGATEFLGYDAEKSEGVVTALIRDGAQTDWLRAGERGAVIVNQTPFYGESGGQVGDIGELRAKGARFRVEATQKKLGDIIVHEGVVEEGEIALGQTLELAVDHARRLATRANHSATHILHEALRQVVGDHVQQKGSLVTPDRLRFDFTHPKPMTEEELAEVERLGNEIVQGNAPVETRLMAQEEAIATGARALFGEKYGDEVRVVSMGRATTPGARAFSVELCGGTHVSRTGDIGLISIVSESAVASGVRRIEARTAEGARAQLVAQSKALREIAALVRAPLEETPARLATLLDERKRLERELADAKRKLAMGGGGDASQPIIDVGGVKLFSRAVSGVDAKDLKGLVDDAKKAGRLRRRRHRQRLRGRQGGRRGWRHRRPYGQIQRRRFRAHRQRKIGRQGWRRTAGPRAGRRSRRASDRRRSGGDPGGAARQGRSMIDRERCDKRAPDRET